MLELTCVNCHAENPRERLYCRECCRILERRTDLWLRVEELQTPRDRDAATLVKSTGILPHLVNQFLVKPKERKLREMLSIEGTPLSTFHNLEAVMHESAYALCLESLPAVYIITMTGPPNAFTFGSDESSVIVVDRRLTEVMGTGELRALLGHEMGHIKSGDMLYHSLAQILAEGVKVSAFLMDLSMISMPMQLALLAWARESEFSADRAALMASGSPLHVVSMLARLTGASYVPTEESTSLLDDVAGFFRTHPNLSERARTVLEFWRTEEYVSIASKIAYRRMVRLAFTPTCRFCESPKSIEAIFCPACGKSQI